MITEGTICSYPWPSLTHIKPHACSQRPDDPPPTPYPPTKQKTERCRPRPQPALADPSEAHFPLLRRRLGERPKRARTPLHGWPCVVSCETIKHTRTHWHTHPHTHTPSPSPLQPRACARRAARRRRCRRCPTPTASTCLWPATLPSTVKTPTTTRPVRRPVCWAIVPATRCARGGPPNPCPHACQNIPFPPPPPKPTTP
jgi:hypothetical protein